MLDSVQAHVNALLDAFQAALLSTVSELLAAIAVILLSLVLFLASLPAGEDPPEAVP